MDILSLLIVVLVVLWLLGYFGHGVVAALPNFSDSSLIHILLVLAVIILLFRILRGHI